MTILSGKSTETDAEGIDAYQVEFIPGLLQTARYAQAMADLFFIPTVRYERSRR